MKNIILTILAITLISCSKAVEIDIAQYFALIRKAEILVTEGKFKAATETYQRSFENIEKPFGKDVFNAALAAQLSDQISERDRYLQMIINNSNDLDFVKSKFVNNYMSAEDWLKLVDKRVLQYQPELRKEFKEIHERDQLFRPKYDLYDDTINANRKYNIARILELTEIGGFPSHLELGYTNYLRGQEHDIVLHHTAQRRSRDKSSVMDLEPLLYEAVQAGRFDPETAIFYMNFQSDLEKGVFEVYPVSQFRHPLLPDSLNNKVWLKSLNEEQMAQANEKRSAWHASSLEEISIKASYDSKNNLPFIFTSVRKSILNIGNDVDQTIALEQYKMMTDFMEEYEN